MEQQRTSHNSVVVGASRRDGCDHSPQNDVDRTDLADGVFLSDNRQWESTEQETDDCRATIVSARSYRAR